jgi:hypothetical protein
MTTYQSPTRRRSCATVSKPGPRMNAREKIGRDNEIVAARMRGLSWATIAAKYELSERQCQQILADFRASHPRLRERDPIEIVDDMLERYEAAQEELALVSATTRYSCRGRARCAMLQQLPLSQTARRAPRTARAQPGQVDPSRGRLMHHSHNRSQSVSIPAVFRLASMIRTCSAGLIHAPRNSSGCPAGSSRSTSAIATLRRLA